MGRRLPIQRPHHISQVSFKRFPCLDGKARASNYFGNYSRAEDWSLSLGFVEGRPAIISRNPVSGEFSGFMLLDWRDGKVVEIRDFRYAPYCLADAEVREG